MKSRLQVIVLLVVSVFLGGCTAVAPVALSNHKGYPADIERILSGESLLGRPYISAEIPDLDLFAITPEMERFADNAVKYSEDNFDRVKKLHVALLSSEASGGRGIAYNAYYTEVPTTAFARRSANCMSFSLLYVAMARYLGIQASINEVHIPPTWDLRSKNSLVSLRHVNVKVALQSENRNLLAKDDVVIDLEMSRYRPFYAQELISDDLVAAHFYSNRGLEFAADGNIEKGFLYLRKALLENDQQSYVWSNFASLYARHGLAKDAEKLYLHGLSLNHDDLSIMNNLALLYAETGDEKKAAIYSKLSENYRLSNPYYQYMLALSADDEKETMSAIHYIERALSLEKKEPRFFDLAARLYTQTGDSVRADKMKAKAEKLRSH